MKSHIDPTFNPTPKFWQFALLVGGLFMAVIIAGCLSDLLRALVP